MVQNKFVPVLSQVSRKKRSNLTPIIECISTASRKGYALFPARQLYALSSQQFCGVVAL
jgi:hypothetical protein